MHGNGDISKDRFWATCSNCNVFVPSTFKGIAEIIHHSLERKVFNFNVRNCRLKFGIPINKAFIPVDKTLTVKFHKNILNGSAQPFIKRKPFPTPIRQGAKPTELVSDHSS